MALSRLTSCPCMMLVESNTRVLECLGLEFDGLRGLVQLTLSRRARLYLAWEALRQRPVASSRELERLIGHLMFAAFLNRSILRCLGACYLFVRKHYHAPHRLWPSVLRELQQFFGLHSLAVGDWWSPWSLTAGVSDAGYVMEEISWTVEEVREVGRWSERW